MEGKTAGVSRPSGKGLYPPDTSAVRAVGRTTTEAVRGRMSLYRSPVPSKMLTTNKRETGMPRDWLRGRRRHRERKTQRTGNKIYEETETNRDTERHRAT